MLFTNVNRLVVKSKQFSKMSKMYTKYYFRKEIVLFAAAAVVEGVIYTIKETSAILIIIGSDLNIVMLSAIAEPSIYLHIVIRSMQRFKYSNSQFQFISQITMTQKPHQFYLTIHLKQLEAYNFYLNAKSQYSKTVVLVFDHPEDTRRI